MALVTFPIELWRYHILPRVELASLLNVASACKTLLKIAFSCQKNVTIPSSLTPTKDHKPLSEHPFVLSVGKMTALEELNITERRKDRFLPSEILKVLPPSLVTLNIEFIDLIRLPESLDKLAKLRNLTIKNVPSLNVSTLVHIPKTITSLKIQNCRKVRDQDVQALQLTQLKQLSVSGCFRLKEPGIGSLISKNTNLQYLHLHKLKLAPVIFNLVSTHCKELTHLNLTATGCGDAGLLAIGSQCKKIKEIHLKFNGRISPIGLVAFAASVTCVEVLDIQGSLVTDRDLSDIAHSLPNLKSIDLRDCSELECDRGLCELLVVCPKLNALFLRNKQVNKTSLGLITEHGHSLKMLFAQECTKLSRDDIISFLKGSGAPKMRTLYASLIAGFDKDDLPIIQEQAKRRNCVVRIDISSPTTDMYIVSPHDITKKPVASRANVNLKTTQD